MGDQTLLDALKRVKVVENLAYKLNFVVKIQRFRVHSIMYLVALDVKSEKWGLKPFTSGLENQFNFYMRLGYYY